MLTSLHQLQMPVEFTFSVPNPLCAMMHGLLDRYGKLRVAHAPGMPGTFSPPPRVSDTDIHHGMCVTLTSGFIWSQWRRKRYRHSRHMRNPQLHVSGQRLMPPGSHCLGSFWYPVVYQYIRKSFEDLMTVDKTYGCLILTNFGDLAEIWGPQYYTCINHRRDIARIRVAFFRA